MIEASKEKNNKPCYEAPVLLSLGEAVRGIAICQAGSSPSGSLSNCSLGDWPDISCTNGNITFDNCSFGGTF